MIPVVEIIRLEEDHRFGTFGILKINKRVFCITLEPPWRENAPLVSCIPEGQYRAVRVKSPKFEETFKLIAVWNRTLIEFHPGNIADDTEGCIIVASEFPKLRSKNRMVLNSGSTFRRFMALLTGYDEILVSIGSNY